MNGWLNRVVGLLVRSHPFRGLIALSGCGAFLVIATSSGVASLQLAPGQLASSLLGESEAMVEPVDGPSAAPGESLPNPSWAGTLSPGVAVITTAKAMVPLGGASGSEQTLYRELAMPSVALDGNTTLEQGRWPAAPGECVVTGERPGGLASPLGSWSLTVVGRVRDVYEPTLREALCAPGTWNLWRLSQEQRRASSYAAAAEYYFTGERDAVSTTLSALLEQNAFGTSPTIERREELSAPKPTSAQRFLGDRAPMLAIPSVLTMIAAGLLARWGGAVARALTRAGIPERPMRRAMVRAAVLGSAGTAAACGALGAVGGVIARPWLMSANAGKPLAPWQFPWGDVLLVASISALAACFGYWLGDAAQGARLRQSDSTHNKLPRPARIAFAAVAVASAGASVWLVLASDGRAWWLIYSVIAMVGASCAVAAAVVPQLSGSLAERRGSATVLGARIVSDDSRRWSGVAGGVTLVLTLGVSLFCVAAGSVAGQILLGASQVPAGSVLLEAVNAAGDAVPKPLQAQFEHDLGVSGPVDLTELDAYVPERGFVELFDSLADARTTLGDLPDEAWQGLERGEVLSFGVASASTTTVIETGAGQTITLPQQTIRPDPSHRYSIGAGFALRARMPEDVKKAPVVRVWHLYRGLTREQDALARTWGTATGMNAFQVMSFRPAEAFSLPTWTTIALVGFGVMIAPVLALALRREARALRPISATLRSVGVRRAWLQPTFICVVGIVVGTAILLAIAASGIVLALLAARYPAVFDVAGVPWWVLGLFLCAVVVACYLAVASSMATLGRKDVTVTI